MSQTKEAAASSSAPAAAGARPWYGLDDSDFVKGVDGEFTNERGITLATRSWMPPLHTIPRGVVIICHGYGHRVTDDEQYDMIADFLARAGYAAHGIDQFGHGDSPGTRNYIPSFEHMVEDILAYTRDLHKSYSKKLDIAKEAASKASSDEAMGEAKAGAGASADGGSEGVSLPVSIPFFLYGESMGGAIAIEATQHEFPWTGVITVAPMCAMDPELVPPACVIKILTCFASCCPEAALIPGKDIIDICFRDEEKKARIDSDPRVYRGKVRLRTGLQLKGAVDHIQPNLGNYKFPLLVFHGSADAVTQPQLSRMMFMESQSNDKTLVTLEGAWHALWWEPPATRTHLKHQILKWLDVRADAAAVGERVSDVSEIVALSEAELAVPVTTPDEPATSGVAAAVEAEARVVEAEAKNVEAEAKNVEEEARAVETQAVVVEEVARAVESEAAAVVSEASAVVSEADSVSAAAAAVSAAASADGAVFQ